MSAPTLDELLDELRELRDDLAGTREKVERLEHKVRVRHDLQELQDGDE